MSNFERLVKESKANVIEKERLYQEWRSEEITKRRNGLKYALSTKVEELIREGLQNDDNSVSGEVYLTISEYGEGKCIYPLEIISTPEYTEFVSTLCESYKPCVITIGNHFIGFNRHYLQIHIKIKDSWFEVNIKKFIDFVSVKKDEYIKLASF